MNPALRVRRLTAADLDFADSLRALAGWNQTRADWARFLAVEPTGCFVAEWNGAPAATATTVVYSNDLGWIGMLLVHPDFRRRGIGAALVIHCVDFLRTRGVRCIKLDATPLGKTVYDGLGFKAEWTFSRWETAHVRANAAVEVSGVRPWRTGDMAAMDELDRHAFGVPRRRMLAALAPDSFCALVQSSASGTIEGHGFLREGAQACYLGPVVANSAEVGRSLIVALIAQVPGRPVYWDVPDLNDAARELAKELGLIQQRSLTRMVLGDNANPGSCRMQFAIAGPEVG